MVDTGRDHHWGRLSSKCSHLKLVPLRATFGPKRNETLQMYVKAVSEQSIMQHICI